ncbi:MAG: hypothetical protein DYG94_05775 [Leptolyngbya sp. PLA3]|nr:MAG: hypothetical protein EDM82_04345 [Cyanobacteria bacterium CYA]MCE7968240.1 hypothetical protein [Leptolyngbya sp. PL-A3]
MSILARSATCGLLMFTPIATCETLIRAVTAPERQPDDDHAYAALVEKVAPAMVTVKFVMAYENEDDTTEEEIDGLTIDPSGVVLVSSAMMFGPEYLGVAARPREIKIILPGQAESMDAEVIVRDRELDLVWLRIIVAESDKPRTFKHVSFKSDAKPALGQEILQVWKLDKFYDRAPYVSSARVAAMVTKPRELFIASGEVTIGLPVFDTSGTVLGFGVLQLPDKEEMDAMTSTNPYSRMIFTRTMLPASRVATATETALATQEDED